MHPTMWVKHDQTPEIWSIMGKGQSNAAVVSTSFNVHLNKFTAFSVCTKIAQRCIQEMEANAPAVHKSNDRRATTGADMGPLI